MKPVLILTIELVPSTAWYNNLRKVLSTAEWDRIRKQVYADYNHRCGICKAEGRLNCHEIWEYDDKKHIQHLRGFIALCDMCHHVKHIGLAGILDTEGRINFEDVIKHFMKVNNCSRKFFDEHHKISKKQWRERSKFKWKTDLGNYEELIKKPKLSH